MIDADSFNICVSGLLEKANISCKDFSIQKANRGGNNRIFRVETPEKRYAVKQYFREASDKRDRLASEFSFLLYAKNAAAQFVPYPYSKDDEHHLALYEFIEGEPISANQITAHEISQAINFFRSLNDPILRNQALHLPLASEVSFSIDGHLKLIDARIATLKQAIERAAEDSNATAVIKELSQYWQSFLGKIQSLSKVNSVDLHAELDVSQRCLSPSDFGFHNALMMPDGKVCFIDFEYAGWDDPARMVGDFFAQLAVPVDIRYFDKFVESVMTPFSNPSLLIQRAKILRSVYQFKWCCIALNVFIPVNLVRRQFANPNLNVIEFKNAQLIKAQTILQQVEI